jgi:hypothetical protein
MEFEGLLSVYCHCRSSSSSCCCCCSGGSSNSSSGGGGGCGIIIIIFIGRDTISFMLGIYTYIP